MLFIHTFNSAIRQAFLGKMCVLTDMKSVKFTIYQSACVREREKDSECVRVSAIVVCVCVRARETEQVCLV